MLASRRATLCPVYFEAYLVFFDRFNYHYCNVRNYISICICPLSVQFTFDSPIGRVRELSNDVENGFSDPCATFLTVPGRFHIGEEGYGLVSSAFTFLHGRQPRCLLWWSVSRSICKWGRSPSFRCLRRPFRWPKRGILAIRFMRPRCSYQIRFNVLILCMTDFVS